MDETKQADEEKSAPVPERRDEDGLPLDREPTLDDVRGNDGSHRAAAIGCSVVVALALIAFWLLRGYLLR
jgi:hypothetical protein